MSGNQAESWTASMRAEQSAFDLGAELGPADPTAFTARKPIEAPISPVPSTATEGCRN